MAPGRSINNLFALIFISMLMYGAKAHAQISHQPTDGKAPWVLEKDATADQFSVEANRARVIFFHLVANNEALGSAPLNIFIDGQYHASLLPEHQSIALSLCPGKKMVSVSLDAHPDKTSQLLPGLESVTPVLQRGEIYFYQVATDKNDKVYSRWVSREMAREVLANVKVQTHTISRVQDEGECPVDIYTLNASALFKFARHDVQGMVNGALESLADLSERIVKGYISIDKVIVKGYTDPIGNESDNQYLSEKRAATVSQQLVSHGLSSDVISFQGVGESNLVVSDCDKYTGHDEKIRCNQPNRRVEVEVYGVAVGDKATRDVY